MQCTYILYICLAICINSPSVHQSGLSMSCYSLGHGTEIVQSPFQEGAIFLIVVLHDLFLIHPKNRPIFLMCGKLNMAFLCHHVPCRIIANKTELHFIRLQKYYIICTSFWWVKCLPSHLLQTILQYSAPPQFYGLSSVSPCKNVEATARMWRQQPKCPSNVHLMVDYSIICQIGEKGT